MTATAKQYAETNKTLYRDYKQRLKQRDLLTVGQANSEICLPGNKLILYRSFMAKKEKKRSVPSRPDGEIESILRPHWMKFINEYLSNGGNGTKAYSKTYPDVKDENVAGTAAARLLRNVRIRSEINSRLEAQYVTEAAIIEALWKVAVNYTDTKSVFSSVKALEVLARIRGMLTDTKKIEFTGENPAVFLPLYSAEEAEEMRKMFVSGKRIIE